MVNDMRYEKVKEGIFLKRENRFVATCLVDGKEELVHVKNTGKMGELFVEGYRAVLTPAKNSGRKTKYDLVMIHDGNQYYNVDSLMPNLLFREAVENGVIALEGYEKNLVIKAEQKYGNSRFDFYLKGEREGFAEVKGVTLNESGKALFPDAVTLRGLKHVEELRRAKTEGYDAFVVFVVQFENAHGFSINPGHDYLLDALKKAQSEGVRIMALKSSVSMDSIEITGQIDVLL